VKFIIALFIARAAIADVAIIPKATELLAVASNHTGETLIVWNDDSVARAAVFTRAGLTQPFVIGTLGFWSGVAAASDGNEFLIVNDLNGNLRGTNFTIANGSYPTYIERPAVAWNGTNYIVAATAHTYIAYNETFASRTYVVSRSHEVTPLDPSISADRIACDGGVCLFTFAGDHAIFANGNPLDAESVSPSIGDVIFDGRTFVVAWQDGSKIVISRITRDGNVLDERIEIGRGRHPTLTSSIITWEDDQSHIRAARLSTLDEIPMPGDAIGTSPFAVKTYFGDAILYKRDDRIFLHAIDAAPRRRIVSAGE